MSGSCISWLCSDIRPAINTSSLPFVTLQSLVERSKVTVTNTTVLNTNDSAVAQSYRAVLALTASNSRSSIAHQSATQMLKIYWPLFLLQQFFYSEDVPICDPDLYLFTAAEMLTQ